MVFEKLIRYAGLAVGLKPSARQGEARLRGLERIIYSKTITLTAIAALVHLAALWYCIEAQEHMSFFYTFSMRK